MSLPQGYLWWGVVYGLQQMGTLCCSCLHVMAFLAHSSNFFKAFYPYFLALIKEAMDYSFMGGHML